MKLYDISREILTSMVYPGDPEPRVDWVSSIKNGEPYNLSSISMCSHTATHVDAPYHFIEAGERLGDIPLSKFYGACTVLTIRGMITGEDMERILPYCKSKVILHGDGKALLTQSAAFVIADSGVELIGTDALSIASPYEEERVHKELLSEGVVILEGLNLNGIEDGEYILSAFPIKTSELEAAPCRAVLFQQEKGY
ncbi:MAG: cyclase family protein [Acutalibacteraceae bacterium]